MFFKSGKILYTGNGMIRTVDTLRIYHDVDTAGGQSGAPIYYLGSDGKYTVVAIHTSGVGSTAYNGGRRIDSSLLELLNSAK